MTQIVFQNPVGRPIGLPLALDRRRRRLSTLAKRHADRSRGYIVSVHRRGERLEITDSTVRLRKQWAETLVGPDDVVVIRYVALGGAGKQIGFALASIALAVAAPYAVGMLGGAFATTIGGVTTLTTLGKIASAALIIGGTALLSLAAKPKADPEDRSEVYGVSGGGNLPRPGERIPVLYGRYWTQPDLSQPDYARYEGDDQVLFKRMTVSLGRRNIKTIRVGDRELWNSTDGINTTNFPGAEVEVIHPGETSSLVPGDVITSPSVAGLIPPKVSEGGGWTSPYPVSPAGVTVSRIQLDVTFPQMYRQNNSDGKIRHGWNTVRFQYAPINDDGDVIGSWQYLTEVGVSTKSMKPVRRTVFANVPEGRYAVRAQQDGQPPNWGSNTFYNEGSWDALRGIKPDVRVREHVTEVAIKIRASERTGNIAVNDVWVEAVSVVPVWDGTAWVENENRKAVWAYADVLRNQTYGGARSDAEIDIAILEHYASTLTGFDTFDGVIRGPDSVYNVASTILSVMRAEPVWIRSLWSLVRDEPKALARHVISPRQIVLGTSSKKQTIGLDGESDIIVEYDLGGDPLKPREYQQTYGPKSLTPTRVRLTGVSTHQHAVHLARWLAAVPYYRRWIVGGDVEMEGRIFRRGDRAIWPVVFMEGARRAGVLDVNARTLTLDTEIEAAENDYVIIRARDGREFGPIAITNGDSNLEIVLDASDLAAAEVSYGKTLSQVVAQSKADPTTILVGTLSALDESVIIKTVDPTSPDRSTVTAVVDSDAVWTAIGATMPEEPLPPSAIANPLAPIAPWVRAHAAGEVESRVYFEVGLAPGAASYRVEMAYQVGDDETYAPEWMRIDDNGLPYGSVAVAYDPENTTILIRAWAIGPTGLAGPVVTTQIDAVPAVIEPSPNSVGWEEFAQEWRERETFWQQQYNDLRAQLDQLAADVASGNTGRWSQSQTLRTEVRAATDRLAARVSQAFFAGITDDEAFAAILEEVTANLSDEAKNEVVAAATAFRNSTTMVNENFDEVYEAIADVEEGVEVIVGNLLAEGKIRFTAVSGTLPSGVAARVAIEVRAGTSDNFSFAGVYLDAMAIGGSRVVIQADKFAVGNATGTAFPFTFDSSTGQLRVTKLYVGPKIELDGENGRIVMRA